MTRNVAIFLLAAVGTTPSYVAAQSAGSWLQLSGGGSRDRQPQTGFEAAGEYGRYLSPTMTLSATTRWQHGAAAGEATSTVAPGARMTWSMPSLRTGLEAHGAVLLGAPAASAEPVLAARAQVGAGHGVTLHAGVGRDRYTSTQASLDTLLMRTRYDAGVDRAASAHWAFELAARQETFGDGNPVNTAFGWLLVPISASSAHRLRAGYALAWQDSDESRWVPDESRRGRGGNSPDTIPGRYDPYYSPHDVVVHSALLEGVVAIGTTWLTLKTSIGVHATETAPVLQRATPVPAAPELVFYERTFHPSQSSAALYVPVGNVASLRIETWHDRTAFYNVTGARFAFSRQLGGE